MQAGGRRFESDQLHQLPYRGITSEGRRSAFSRDSSGVVAVRSLTIWKKCECVSLVQSGTRVVDCINQARSARSELELKRCSSCNPSLRAPSPRALGVIGSSEQVHVVDALAITGDEGRRSVRKAPGSPQTGFDPEMSEWGNPARKGHPPLNP